MVIIHYPQPSCCLGTSELERAFRGSSPHAAVAVPGAARVLIHHAHH